MNQYRIQLQGVMQLLIDENEFARFAKLYDESGDTVLIELTDTDNQVWYVSKQSISYIIKESEPVESGVVLSPSPEQVRENEEKAKEAMPITLDDQLANPEVGK